LFSSSEAKMTCSWELYMGASLSLLASRDLRICGLDLAEKL
jgi:hypothetical protein